MAEQLGFQLIYVNDLPDSTRSITDIANGRIYLPPASIPGADSHGRPFYSLIVDGVHAHPYAVALAYETHPAGLILVTDAMQAMGLPVGRHTLGGWGCKGSGRVCVPSLVFSACLFHRYAPSAVHGTAPTAQATWT